MFLVKALSGNYLLSAGKNPTWTPHAQLAMKFKSEEFASSVSRQMADFWGISCRIEPWFTDRTTYSSNKPFSTQSGNFEYTI